MLADCYIRPSPYFFLFAFICSACFTCLRGFCAVLRVFCAVPYSPTLCTLSQVSALLPFKFLSSPVVPNSEGQRADSAPGGKLFCLRHRHLTDLRTPHAAGISPTPPAALESPCTYVRVARCLAYSASASGGHGLGGAAGRKTPWVARLSEPSSTDPVVPNPCGVRGVQAFARRQAPVACVALHKPRIQVPPVPAATRRLETWHT